MASNALPPRGTAVLLALLLALLVFQLGRAPLLGPDEPRYARVAVEMARRGDLVTPTLGGQPWLEKPALYYWLAGAAFRVLGETETAARLPSVAGALLLVGATALVGARLYGGAAGLQAGFVLATSLLVFAYGRAAAMDMLLAGTLTAGLGLIALRLLGVAGRLAVPFGHAFLGLAVLAKGPLGVLLPGLVVLAYLALTRQWRFARELFAPRALLAVALVALPWYLAVGLAQGSRFVEVFFLNHNLQRFTSTIHNHPGPFWYYVPVLVGLMFPWSGLVLAGVASLRPRLSRTDLLVALWLGLPLLFFSAAGSKLPGYALPCLPPLALLCGRVAARFDQARWELPFWAGPRAVALVGLLLGALIGVAGPAWLYRAGDPGWVGALTPCLWALLTGFLASRAFEADPAAGLRVLRVGGAGLLLLLALAAPPLLARHESGRELFRETRGREVLAWGAWRTAWMSGYFYNDGRVREVSGLPELGAALRQGPALVLVGPGERRQLLASPAFSATLVTEGVRRNALFEVRAR